MLELPPFVHLVIIGAGASGARLAKLIYDHPKYNVTVTLLATSRRHLHTPAAVRLCAQAELYDQFTLDLKNLYENEKRATLESYPSQVRVKFIEGRARAIDLKSKIISYSELEEDVFSETTKELRYDLLVLATGSLQCSPLWGYFGREEETRLAMIKLTEKLKTAKRVAIVGAGATGIEVSAEVVEANPNLRGYVDLYAGTELPMISSIGQRRSQIIVSRLTKMGVNVIQKCAEFEEVGDQFAVKGSDDSSHLVDVVIPTSGAKINIDYLKDHTDLIDAQDGTVKTDEFLRVCENVYAIGDIVRGSAKSWPDAREMADIVLQTILVDLKISSSSKLTKYNSARWKTTKFITLGKNDGVAVVSGYSLPAFAVSWLKGKDFLVKKFADIKP